MKLIFKYLKKHIVTILAVVVLTYLQVQTELALPDYMSDIVSNGIQYSGITETIPKALTQTDKEKLEFFLNEKEIEILNDSYVLVHANDKAVCNNQEIVFNEDTYILKEENSLNDILSKPLMYLSVVNQNNIDITKIDKETLLKQLNNQSNNLQDNTNSLIKFEIQNLYKNVGLSIQTIQNDYILHVGLVMLGVSLFSVIVQLLSTYLATKTAAKIAAKMREDVFEKVESFSSSEFSKFSTSSLITRTGNDITKLQQLIQMMMRIMLMSPMMGITAVIKVSKYPQVSWILLVAIGIIISAMILLAVFALPKFEQIQKLLDKINSLMREFLDGILVIRAFNQQKNEEEKFDDTNKEYQAIDRFVSRLVNIISPILTMIMNGLTIIIIYYSAKQIDMDVMTIGDMMAFIQYAIHVVMSFMIVTVTFVMIPRSLVSAKRIQEVLNTDLTINDIDNPVPLPKENGELAFNNVSFQYPGAQEKVLDNVSFVAKPSQTVAIIGSTGSGKSTIIKLIPRLFDVTEGSITYSGIDIRNISQEELRNRIGFATQKAILFSGDIKENIDFGRNLSDEQINEAIRVSQSQNIIDEKQEGIYAPITQGGTNVSGGQKQRISIARALAENKSIYIFDDSFSALDYETDKKLRKDLNELIQKTKATVIIVAQRISTIKNSDKILVIDDGKIVGEGKHQDLLKTCQVYKQIAYSQLSKEELENA